MKRIFRTVSSTLLMLLFLGIATQSCKSDKTYAEQKEEEAAAIKSFMKARNFKEISEEQFEKQNYTTATNEYVFLKKTGVYMNVMNTGEAEKVLPNGTYQVLFRFVEIMVQDRKEDMGKQAGDTIVYNMHKYENPSLLSLPDEAQVTISNTTISGTFTGLALLAQTHRGDNRNNTYSSAVPTGWLIPLRYIKPSRTDSAEKIARVRLIVPHAEGHFSATENVCPYFYELTYNLGR